MKEDKPVHMTLATPPFRTPSGHSTVSCSKGCPHFRINLHYQIVHSVLHRDGGDLDSRGEEWRGSTVHFYIQSQLYHCKLHTRYLLLALFTEVRVVPLQPVPLDKLLERLVQGLRFDRQREGEEGLLLLKGVVTAPADLLV